MSPLEITQAIVYSIILIVMTCLAAPKLAEREVERKQAAPENKESALVHIRSAVVYIGLSLMFLGGAALANPHVTGRLIPSLDPANGRIIGLFMAGGATYITVHLLMKAVDGKAMHFMLMLTVVAAIAFAVLEDMQSHGNKNLEIQIALAGGILLDYIQKLVKWIYPRQEH